jgi:hypothetical protein
MKQELAAKKIEADQAVIKSQIGFMDVLNLQRFANKIAEGHRNLQQENNFGYRVFGVEKR